ncbi:hypothetical protein GpartN1_g1080.t1 [Galdieria partita]|uniref:Uncharacterized protein n=1 Tax=Galdieria partita TaxID=83374 RepID=A0A9C7PS87_9RHOD|nr:hypothetical protein GpartN1_g1080.t1 [Galdieria partita]
MIRTEKGLAWQVFSYYSGERFYLKSASLLATHVRVALWGRRKVVVTEYCRHCKTCLRFNRPRVPCSLGKVPFYIYYKSNFEQLLILYLLVTWSQVRKVRSCFQSLLGPHCVNNRLAAYDMLKISRVTVADKEENRERVNSLTHRNSPSFVSPNKQLVGHWKAYQDDLGYHSGLFLHRTRSTFVKCILLYMLLWLICAYLLIEKAGDWQLQQRKGFRKFPKSLKNGETMGWESLANHTNSVVTTSDSADSFRRQVNIGRAVVDSMMKEIISQTRKESNVEMESDDDLGMIDMNEEIMQRVMNRLKEELQVDEQSVDSTKSNRKEPLCKFWLNSCTRLVSKSSLGKYVEKTVVQNDKLQRILQVSESWIGRIAIFFFMTALVRQFIESGNPMTWTPW